MNEEYGWFTTFEFPKKETAGEICEKLLKKKYIVKVCKGTQGFYVRYRKAAV